LVWIASRKLRRRSPDPIAKRAIVSLLPDGCCRVRAGLGHAWRKGEKHNKDPSP
jgi:hypothetical protein